MKAVAFDLDDTLLHDDLTISDYTVSVFRELHRRGFFVIAASGRSRFSMKPYIDQLSCVDVCIACNGAEIWSCIPYHLICREMIPEDTAIEIVRFGESYGSYIQVYENDSFFFNRHSEYQRKYASSARLKGVYVGKMSEYIHEPRNKILMIGEPDRITDLYEKACILFAGKVYVTRSKRHYLEFVPVKATKGIALKTAADYFHIRLEDTIAFGDSLNDLPMFQTAGLAVSVSNGWNEVLPFCDAVCGSNNDDGPAHYLSDHYLSREEIV